MRTRIILVGYYHAADGFLGGLKALSKLKNAIYDFFPLSAYKNEYRNNPEIIEDHLAKFINAEKHVYVGTQLNKDCEDDMQNIIIWWHNTNLFFEHIENVKKKCTANNKWVYYSWDDPTSMKYFVPLHSNQFRHFDLCVTCDQSSHNFYYLGGAQKVVFAPPGFDTEIHHPIKEENETDRLKYECDINLVCTNLYDDDDPKHINRKHLLNKLIEDGRFKIHLYGPESFKNQYPAIYKGYSKFDELHKIFHYSRISLCTHVTKLGFGYINERTTQILGSGGLLFIDNIRGLSEILENPGECVIIDENNYCNQIHNILEMYKSNPQRIKTIRDAGHKRAMESYQWSNWAQIIVDGLAEDDDDDVNESDNVTETKSELFNLLCSTYISNTPLNGKLQLIEDLAESTNKIDINKFVNSNVESVIRHSSH